MLAFQASMFASIAVFPGEAAGSPPVHPQFTPSALFSRTDYGIVCGMWKAWLVREWTLATDGRDDRDSPFETRGQMIAASSRTLEPFDGQQES